MTTLFCREFFELKPENIELVTNFKQSGFVIVMGKNLQEFKKNYEYLDILKQIPLGHDRHTKFYALKVKRDD